jgi:hypothetical protein
MMYICLSCNQPTVKQTTNVQHPWLFTAVRFYLAFCVVFFVVLCVFVLCLVYPMLLVSMDCPFLIAPSVFSNVYLFCGLCTQWYQFLWIVHSLLVLRFSLMCIYYLVCLVPCCSQCYHCLWIVYSWLPLRISLTCIYYLQYVLCLVFPILPLSLDCIFLIFPKVYFHLIFLLFV